jgi:hypothetical protein
VLSLAGVAAGELLLDGTQDLLLAQGPVRSHEAAFVRIAGQAFDDRLGRQQLKSVAGGSDKFLP